MSTQLPRRVREQLEAAEALQAQLATPTAPEPAPEPAPSEPTQNTDATAEPPAVSPPPAPESEAKWEARFKSLQGLFNQQVPALQQQVQRLTSELENLRRAPPAPAPAPTPAPAKPAIDSQDADTFGNDLTAMVLRVSERVVDHATSQLNAMVADFENRLKQLESTAQSTVQRVEVTAESAFFDRLGREVPDWEEVNMDEAFLRWLVVPDPVYGKTRQEVLTAAQQTKNPERAIAVFKEFKAQVAPPPAAPKPASPAVQKQVSPPAGGASAPPAPTEKPVITQAEVTAFYRDVAQGRFRGREAEMQRIELIINEALSEGRIR